MSASIVAATSLTPTQLRAVRSLFDVASDLDPLSRDRFLADACRDEPWLREEVESLIRALEDPDETFRHPALKLVRSSSGDSPFYPDAAECFAGSRAGPYELVTRIGAGGMGAVYEAVRADDHFRKRVAIKLLRRGVEGDVAVRRFRYERQILAELHHPNIAALLDGGVSTDGQPYFVMELVPGSPITTWCDQRGASIRQRIEVFLQVCAAVQHAHRALVVHRDLKPGNILVTDDGIVKLLDFGIARLLREQEGLDQLPPTQGGLRALTPEYASPEQIRGLPVGTAGDVYALGVILFELLTGRRPLPLGGKLLAEIEQTVCNEPPPRPSAVVVPTFAERTGERSSTRVRARLRGDLDAIVLTALRKESDRRYGSVERLADDLRRFLDGRTVSARPETLSYRATKFARRRRIECAAALAILVTAGGAIVVSAQEQARIRDVNGRLTQALAQGACRPQSP